MCIFQYINHRYADDKRVLRDVKFASWNVVQHITVSTETEMLYSYDLSRRIWRYERVKPVGFNFRKTFIFDPTCFGLVSHPVGTVQQHNCDPCGQLLSETRQIVHTHTTTNVHCWFTVQLYWCIRQRCVVDLVVFADRFCDLNSWPHYTGQVQSCGVKQSGHTVLPSQVLVSNPRTGTTPNRYWHRRCLSLTVCLNSGTWELALERLPTLGDSGTNRSLVFSEILNFR